MKRTVVTNRADVLLEFRVAVLEGIVDWLLKNNSLPANITRQEIDKIDQYALESVKKHHPGVEMELIGQWAKGEGYE